MSDDRESIEAELPFIWGSLWFQKLMEELDAYREYKLRSILTCEDLKTLGYLQGAIRAIDDVKVKLLKED